MGEDVGQFIRDYVFQVGVALIALTGVVAVWIKFRRRRYVKSVEFKRGVEALRLELRRSVDETRAAAARKAATVGDKLLSVIKPIDANVAELHVRLARLEEFANSVEAFMAGPQKNVQDNEQIAVRLRTLEQKLTALTDQVSLIERAIDGLNRKGQEKNNAIEVRLTSAEKQMGEFVPRLELGEKARADLGGLISLFVKQLKRVNTTSTEAAVRVAKLESLHSKVERLEQRLRSPVNNESHPPAENLTADCHADIGPTSPNPADEAGIIETNNASVEDKPTSTEEPPNEPEFPVSSLSANSSAGANGHA